jgi:serine/threonine protein kinase
MEHAELGDLLSVIENRCDEGVAGKPLTSEEVAEMGRQLASGLVFLHSRNIIHRDMKLENALVGGMSKSGAPTDLKVRLLPDGHGASACALPSPTAATTSTCTPRLRRYS